MNKEQKIVYPEQVVFEKVLFEMIRDGNGKLWAPYLEERARHENATHTICSACKTKTAEFKGGVCRGCREALNKEKYLKLPVSSEFPISLDGDRFIWDEGELEDYLEENECSVEELFLYGCEQNPFMELDDCWWDDQKTEDGELPKALSDLVAQFNEKLKEIPGYWFCDYKTRYVPANS